MCLRRYVFFGIKLRKVRRGKIEPEFASVCVCFNNLGYHHFVQNLDLFLVVSMTPGYFHTWASAMKRTHTQNHFRWVEIHSLYPFRHSIDNGFIIIRFYSSAIIGFVFFHNGKYLLFGWWRKGVSTHVSRSFFRCFVGLGTGLVRCLVTRRRILNNAIVVFFFVLLSFVRFLGNLANLFGVCSRYFGTGGFTSFLTTTNDTELIGFCFFVPLRSMNDTDI